MNSVVASELVRRLGKQMRWVLFSGHCTVLLSLNWTRSALSSENCGERSALNSHLTCEIREINVEKWRVVTAFSPAKI